MAFKKVNQIGFDGETRKASQMKIGEPLTAYVVSIDSYTHEDQSFNNLIMQDKETGEQFKLQTCGNLAFMVKDGKLKEGRLTQITKTEEMNKTNKRTQFEVLQDAEDVLSSGDDADPIDRALGAADGNAEADRKASVAKATEQGIVAAQAKKLAAQHTKRG